MVEPTRVTTCQNPFSSLSKTVFEVVERRKQSVPSGRRCHHLVHQSETTTVSGSRVQVQGTLLEYRTSFQVLYDFRFRGVICLRIVTNNPNTNGGSLR